MYIVYVFVDGDDDDDDGGDGDDDADSTGIMNVYPLNPPNASQRTYAYHVQLYPLESRLR